MKIQHLGDDEHRIIRQPDYKAIFHLYLICTTIILPFFIEDIREGRMLKTGISLILLLLLTGISYLGMKLRNKELVEYLFMLTYLLINSGILYFTSSNVLSILFILPLPLLANAFLGYRGALLMNSIILVLFSIRLAFIFTIENQIIDISFVGYTAATYIIIVFVSFIRERSYNKDQESMNTKIYFDELTGLANKINLHIHLDHVFSPNDRNPKKFALLFINVDNFKWINNSMGHHAGDMVLAELAKRMQATIRTEDFAARKGGDEFVLVLQEINGELSAAHIAKRILETVSVPIDYSGISIHTSISIGIAGFPYDGITKEDLLRNSNIAMHHAKQSGGNTFSFFKEEYNRIIQERIEIELRLMKALDNDELSVAFQLKVNAKNGSILGVEALIRWYNPDLGHVEPAVFIPIAEETGLIHNLSAWMYEEAFKQMKVIQNSGFSNLDLAINVSPIQLQKGTLVECLNNAVSQSGIHPCCIELEITEGILLDTDESLKDMLKSLKTQGFSIAVDDFGTGYSSLRYLKDFHVDTLKIDRSFVGKMVTDQDFQEIVKAIVSMAKSLKLTTVAEGVESEEEQKILQSLGCDILQGFYFSRPIGMEQLVKTLRINEDQYSLLMI